MPSGPTPCGGLQWSRAAAGIATGLSTWGDTSSEGIFHAAWTSTHTQMNQFVLVRGHQAPQTVPVSACGPV